MTEANRPDDRKRIGDNLAAVYDRMERAAQRSGRTVADIQLVAVSKYLSPELTRLLIDAGCSNLGESRPQQLWQKAELIQDEQIKWHMIGHLQRNKLSRTLPHVHLIHSIDSKRLWQAVDEWACSKEVTIDGLIEVNVSGDATKHGFPPDDVESVTQQMSQPTFDSRSTIPGLRIQGLMAMAGLQGGLEQARQDFSQLHELRERLRRQLPEHSSWKELSMGMSGDYEAAIAEGATIVRIGSALVAGVTSA